MQPVVRCSAPQVPVEQLDRRVRHQVPHAFLPVRQTGDVVVVLVQQVLLEQREALLLDHREGALGEEGVERVEPVDERVEREAVADQVVGQPDLVLQDHRELGLLAVHRVEDPAEPAVRDDLAAVGDEVGADVEVVDGVLLEDGQQVGPDLRDRHRLRRSRCRTRRWCWPGPWSPAAPTTRRAGESICANTSSSGRSR